MSRISQLMQNKMQQKIFIWFRISTIFIKRGQTDLIKYKKLLTWILRQLTNIVAFYRSHQLPKILMFVFVRSRKPHLTQTNKNVFLSWVFLFTYDKISDHQKMKATLKFTNVDHKPVYIPDLHRNLYNTLMC